MNSVQNTGHNIDPCRTDDSEIQQLDFWPCKHIHIVDVRMDLIITVDLVKSVIHFRNVTEFHDQICRMLLPSPVIQYLLCRRI